MPKAIKGCLIQCDPPQMAMIEKIDRESHNEYVIEKIDDRVCLVKENKAEELKARVKSIMDRAMGADEEEVEDQDSDLD
ncbi:hypothetical protein PMZ80_005309 [Knufia obscura]|uniref:General transcription and DNA repair factor IIH subunit TFB5 n=2 Tax=Knufia TaxID=430999 RepID=A0AAN8F0Q9_9EURO|nr:hypothetical protein PMZ80_005309 [Knufia obscura]KAK5957976.1 hypothetical protein OHC33_001166 [Knufia fluminis]